MIESHPIPKIAARAMAQTDRTYQQTASAIGQETIEAMGLKEGDNWTVDFPAGKVWREVPDPPEPADRTSADSSSPDATA